MNLPNQLTLSRLGMTLLFLVALFVEFPFHHTTALLLFSAASLTDFFDGRIARSRNLITDFGILMDPLADKILTCSAFIGFVGLQMMPAWMVVIIVSRELAITGLRMLAASKNRVLAAEGFGKHKTISQMVAIIAMLVMISYPEMGPIGQVFSFEFLGAPWVERVATLMIWIAVFLTFLSGFLYLWNNREIYLKDA